MSALGPRRAGRRRRDDAPPRGRRGAEAAAPSAGARRTRAAILTGSLAALLAWPAAAQEVRGCDVAEASARNLVFPVEDNTRGYANGAVRLIALDTGGEPACCSSHLMVLLPSPEDSGQICALISHRGSLGWQRLYLPGALARYDPARGLTVSVPASEYGVRHPTPLSVEVTVNQQTGEVGAVYGPP